MDTSVILEFRSIINSVDLMFYTLDSGDYHEWRILKYDELEGYFEETISKIRNFNTQRLNDELAKNINELDNNLKTIRLMLRERPQMIDENSGFFPEDFKCYRSKLLRDGDDKWANGVLCGFMAVASWANGLIEDFFSVIEEYEQMICGDEQEQIRKFKSKYSFVIKDIDGFIRDLQDMKGAMLRRFYDNAIAKSDISLKEFVNDCLKLTPKRINEKGWNYEAIKKY